MKKGKVTPGAGIASQLRNMKIGEEIEFELSQHTTLCGTRSRLKKEPNLSDAHWSFFSDALTKKVYVKRTL